MSNAIDVAVLTCDSSDMFRSLWFLSCLIFFTCSVGAREFPASWKFVTMRTAHFDLIVNAEQQDLGAFYARKLEKAYALARPMFTDLPERTVVVLADKTDVTNGYATRLPYPHIFIFPVPPGPQESLGESGDWELELVAHEFTHIATFDAVTGVMEPLQSVFGTILSPNLLLPTWWKEGVAVHVESTVASGGRLRSAYQDGVIRAFERDNRLASFDIAQINEALPDWPQGLRPYLFGSLFWSEAVSRKGAPVIDGLHQRHGGRIPYFIEEPARDLLGTSYEVFYSIALDETRRRARAQIEVLETVPTSLSTELLFTSKTTLGPKISPDGSRLAMISVGPALRRSVRVFRRSETSGTFVDGTEIESFVNRREEDILPETQDGPPTGSISRLSWLPDGRRLVFDKVDAVSRHETWSDLWLFDTDNGETERLSKGLRAREPFASGDGRTVFFTGLSGGRTWIGAFDLETKTTRRLFEGSFGERAAFPAELRDGRVIFSLRTPDGREGLRIIPREGGPALAILGEFPNARFPEPTKRGLLFSSTKNGVHNLYLADEAMATARPATHAASAVFTVALDPQRDDLYITTMTAEGPFVRHVERAEMERVLGRDQLPWIGPLFADRYPAVAPTEDAAVPLEVETYEASRYLWPQYWFPMFGLSAVNNSLVVQASTSGHDPLKKHQYALTASYDSGLQKAGFAGTYQNGVWPHSAIFTATRSTSYLVSTDNPVTTDSASASVLPDMFRINRYLAASIGWRWLRTDSSGSVGERTGPSMVLQYTDYGRTGDQISPEDGGSATLGAVDYLPGGDRLDYMQYLAGGSFFFSRGLPARHAVALRSAISYAPDLVRASFGTQTTNFFMVPDPPGLSFVMRGYRVGHFFGKSLGNAGAEYRFPLREIRRGSGTDPLYLIRVHGAVFVDAAVVDGFAYRPGDNVFRAVSTDRVFSSAGAEARFETTVGYLLPLNFIVGFAMPSDRGFSDGPGALVSLQMGAVF